MMWFFETNGDHEPAEMRAAIFVEGAEQAVLDKTVENFQALANKYNARWADGRAHVAGATLTAADFALLT